MLTRLFYLFLPRAGWASLRPTGLAVSMILNRIFLNKRYTLLQIASVVIVSGGVLLATLSRPAPAARSSSPSNHDPYEYAIGVGMLSLATILTSTLGIVQERTFAKYGASTWREGVFYTVSMHSGSCIDIFC